MRERDREKRRQGRNGLRRRVRFFVSSSESSSSSTIHLRNAYEKRLVERYEFENEAFVDPIEEELVLLLQVEVLSSWVEQREQQPWLKLQQLEQPCPC